MEECYMDDELGKYFDVSSCSLTEVLRRYLSGGTEEIQGKYQSRYLKSKADVFTCIQIGSSV
jgi:hypothetical protein